MGEKATRAEAAGKRSFKTIAVWLPDEAAPAARAIARQGRDIQNTALFLLRSALASYDWDKATRASVLRAEGLRPPGSGEALKALNAMIATLNQERAKKAAEGEPAAKALEPLGERVVSLARTLLDPSLLERTLKERPDSLALDQKPAFGRLPFKLARGFSEAARGSVSTWLKSVAAWGPGGAAGRPRPPGYQAKGKLPPIEIAEARCRLPRIGKLNLFVDEAKSVALTEAEKAAWDGLDLKDLLEKALKGRWSEPGRRPGHWAAAPGLGDVKSLRILVRGARAKLQLVVEATAAPPAGSFYAELAARRPEEWARLWAGQRKGFDAWMGKLAGARGWRSKAPPDAGQKPDPLAWIEERFSVCGVDLGVSNVAAVGFSDGSKGSILSGREIDRRLGQIDRKIDALVSRLTCPEQRGLQAKREAAKASGQPFPAADARRLRALSAALHQSEPILRLRGQRKRLVRNFAHQTAFAIAEMAADKKAAFVVAGRNLGWKTESDLGKEQNRRFHRIPHGLILALLREKLDERGVALLETEESWTSRASFADREPLERPSAAAPKAKRAKKEKKASAAQAAPGGSAPPAAFLREIAKEAEAKENELIDINRAEPAHSARRGEGGERNWLLRRGPWPRAATRGEFGRPRVHADLNGALNIIRKACPRFGWSERVSLKHEIWGFWSGRGFAPLDPRARPQRV